MRPEQRCSLIDHVVRRVYGFTESFEPHLIGVHLAYLAWEIAKDPPGKVDWTTTDSKVILDLFVEIFPADDPVWGFIIRPRNRDFIVTGRRPFMGQESAHVVATDMGGAALKFTVDVLYGGEVMPDDWQERPHDLNGEPWAIIDAIFEIDGPPLDIEIPIT